MPAGPLDGLIRFVRPTQTLPAVNRRPFKGRHNQAHYDTYSIAVNQLFCQYVAGSDLSPSLALQRCLFALEFLAVVLRIGAKVAKPRFHLAALDLVSFGD